MLFKLAIMARLLEIVPETPTPTQVVVGVGDVLSIAAPGGMVRDTEHGASGVAPLRLLGAYRQGIIGPDGHPLVPAGPPNVILFLAQAPGRAALDIVAGDPWRSSRPVTIEVLVNE